MKINKPLLCWIGLHRWMELGPVSFVQPFAIAFECMRCHCREIRYGYGTIYFDAPRDGWPDDAAGEVKGEKSNG